MNSSNLPIFPPVFYVITKNVHYSEM